MRPISTLDGRNASDERAVSEVLGAILMFGLVLALLVLTQVTLVPAMNQQVEFEQNMRAQSDVAEFDEAVIRVSNTAQAESITIETGVRYPQRAFLVNPPPSSGIVRTGDPLTVTIENAYATGEAGDYWNGSAVTYRTRPVEYVPDYDQYHTAPRTVYEHTVVYNAFESGAATLNSEGRVVSGDRLTFVSVVGEYYEQSDGALTVGVEPVSGPARTVTVESRAGDPLTITMQTNLPEEQWTTVLSGQESVSDWSYAAGTPATVTVELRPGTYSLRMAQVGVGSGTETVQKPAYVTTVEGDDGQIRPGESQRIVFEVRDAYNNPVRGVTVDATLVPSGEGTLDVVSSTTDADGRAVFLYHAGGRTADVAVVASVDGATGTALTATVDVAVRQSEGAVADSINPAGPQSVLLVRADLASDDGDACSPNNRKVDCDVLVNLRNLGDEPLSIEFVRVNFYSAGAYGLPGSTPPTHVVVDDVTMAIGSDIEGVSLGPIEPAASRTDASNDFQFRAEFERNGTQYAAVEGDFFVISVVYSDGTTAVYFVGVY